MKPLTRSAAQAIRVVFSGLLAAVLVVTAAGGAAAQEVDPAEALAHELPAPTRQQDRDYLGLKPQAENFVLADLETRYVVVQVFSAYCPHCQAETPDVNTAFAQLAKADPELLRFVALGANNTVFEVDLFRDRYEAAYPVVADETMDASFALGAQVTPSYFIVDTKPTPAKIVFSLEGRFDTAESFVEAVLAACKP